MGLVCGDGDGGCRCTSGACQCDETHTCVGTVLVCPQRSRRAGSNGSGSGGREHVASRVLRVVMAAAAAVSMVGRETSSVVGAHH